MVHVEIVKADGQALPLTVLDAIDSLDALEALPHHLQTGDVHVRGMLYLYDEAGRAEGFAEIAIYRSDEDRICLELSQEGTPIVRWENSLSGAPLFRALIAAVVRLDAERRQQDVVSAEPPPPAPAYLLAAELLPQLPWRLAAHLALSSAHGSAPDEPLGAESPSGAGRP
jgi:hypothetical protein